MEFIRETSDAVADEMIDWLDLNAKKKQWILEPSAGKGNIVDRINFHYPDNRFEIDCVELNRSKYEILLSKGYNAYHCDFLNFKQVEPKVKIYDRIIACPPFNNNVDLNHIMSMYDFLGYEGYVVSLTSPLWITNNEPKHIAFREWLKGKDYMMKMLPDNSFMEKGRSVPTMMIKIIWRH